MENSDSLDLMVTRRSSSCVDLGTIEVRATGALVGVAACRCWCSRILFRYMILWRYVCVFLVVFKPQTQGGFINNMKVKTF